MPPGLALAAAISSRRLFCGRAALATSTRSAQLIGATGTKSRVSWKGLFGISDSLTVCVLLITSSVSPSGAALATASLPITEPPPGRLS
jgi:hypothetical protein